MQAVSDCEDLECGYIGGGEEITYFLPNIAVLDAYRLTLQKKKQFITFIKLIHQLRSEAEFWLATPLPKRLSHFELLRVGDEVAEVLTLYCLWQAVSIQATQSTSPHFHCFTSTPGDPLHQSQNLQQKHT